MKTNSNTNMTNALRSAKSKIEELSAGNNNNNIVIFLSDGEPTDNRNSVIKAASALKGVATVYSIGFGSEADTSILKDYIASDTGKYYPATSDLSSLSNVFTTIENEISVEPISKQSENGQIKLTGIYTDVNHKIIINVTNVNGVKKTPIQITTLPDATGKIIEGKDKAYYLDLTKFEAGDTISIECFTK